VGSNLGEPKLNFLFAGKSEGFGKMGLYSETRARKLESGEV